MNQTLDSQGLLELVETERATRLRRRGQEALYGSMIVGAFGLLGYTTCWVYSLLSDATNSIREISQDALVGQPVHPDVFSEAGYDALHDYYRGKRNWTYSAARFSQDWRIAKAEFDSRGAVRALPWAADRVEAWEKILIRAEVIPAEEAVASGAGGVHPFDKITGWVINNRETYFAVVATAMAVPVVPVLAEVVKDAKD